MKVHNSSSKGKILPYELFVHKANFNHFTNELRLQSLLGTNPSVATTIDITIYADPAASYVEEEALTEVGDRAFAAVKHLAADCVMFGSRVGRSADPALGILSDAHDLEWKCRPTTARSDEMISFYPVAAKSRMIVPEQVVNSILVFLGSHDNPCVQVMYARSQVVEGQRRAEMIYNRLEFTVKRNKNIKCDLWSILDASSKQLHQANAALTNMTSDDMRWYPGMGGFEDLIGCDMQPFY